jgi:hypothetical protein
VPINANSTSDGATTRRQPSRAISAPANGAPTAKAKLATAPINCVRSSACGIVAFARSICGSTRPGENRPIVENSPQPSSAASADRSSRMS